MEQAPVVPVPEIRINILSEYVITTENTSHYNELINAINQTPASVHTFVFKQCVFTDIYKFNGVISLLVRRPVIELSFVDCDIDRSCFSSHVTPQPHPRDIGESSYMGKQKTILPLLLTIIPSIGFTNSIKENDIRRFMRLIGKHGKNLQGFAFISHAVSRRNAYLILGTLVDKCTKLTHLMLGGMNLSVEGTFFGLAATRIWKNMKLLSLTRCSIDSLFIMDFLTDIAADGSKTWHVFPKLNRLDLKQNDLDDTAIDWIVAAIQHQCLHIDHLHIDDNDHITDDGRKRAAILRLYGVSVSGFRPQTAIKCHGTLKDDMIPYMVEKIILNGSYLEAVGISSYELSPSTIGYLTKVFVWNCPLLKIFAFGGTDISGTGNQFKEMLLQSSNLETLMLQQCYINGLFIFEMLCDVNPDNSITYTESTSLKALILFDNELDDTAIGIIATAVTNGKLMLERIDIRRNTHLTHISLQYINNMKDRGVAVAHDVQ